MKSAEFWKGFEFACQMIESQGYDKAPIHYNNIADCLRAKMGRMPKSKVRITENGNRFNIDRFSLEIYKDLIQEMLNDTYKPWEENITCIQWREISEIVIREITTLEIILQ